MEQPHGPVVMERLVSVDGPPDEARLRRIAIDEPGRHRHGRSLPVALRTHGRQGTVDEHAVGEPKTIGPTEFPKGWRGGEWRPWERLCLAKDGSPGTARRGEGRWCGGSAGLATVQRRSGDVRSLPLGCVRWIADRDPADIGAGDATSALLGHVCRLVGDQPSPARGIGPIGVAREIDVAAARECHGGDAARQPVRLGIGMDPSGRQVAPEHPFQRRTDTVLERRPVPGTGCEPARHVGRAFLPVARERGDRRSRVSLDGEARCPRRKCKREARARSAGPTLERATGPRYRRGRCATT